MYIRWAECYSTQAHTDKHLKQLAERIHYRKMMKADDLYHIACMGFLGAIGLFLNCIYFVAGINAKQSAFSSIEFLRRFKTVFVILGLSIYTPLDLFSNFWTGEISSILCPLKGMFQRVFLDSQVMVMLSLAVVRLRLSYCKQITILLVNNSQTYITLCVLLLPTILNAMTTFVSFMPVDETNLLSLNNYSKESGPNRSDIYIVCHQRGPLESKVLPYVVLSHLPLVITCCIYLTIIFRTSQFSVFPQTAFSDVRQFNRRRFKKEIKTAFAIFLAMLFLFWLPYTVLEILMMVSDVVMNTKVPRILAYLKIGIFLSNPLNDGGFDRLLRNLQATGIQRQETTVHPVAGKKENVTPNQLSPDDKSKSNEPNLLHHSRITIPTGVDGIEKFDDIMIIDDEIEVGDERLHMRSRATAYMI